MTSSSDTAGAALGIGVVVAVIAAIIGGIIHFSVPYASADSGKACVVTSGGTFQDRNVYDVIPEGANRVYVGYGSDVNCYPTTQRSFILGGPGKDADAEQVNFAGEEGQVVRMYVTAQMYFTLNVREETLENFHSTVGLKEKAWTDEGWTSFLTTYIHPQIQRAIENNALGYNWLEVSTNEEVRKNFENDVKADIRALIDSQVGKDYLCGPNFNGKGSCGDFALTIGKPEVINEDIIESREAEIVNQNRTAAQAEENNRLEEKLDFEGALIEAYGPEGALIWKGLEEGNITFWVLPDGTQVPAPAGPGPASEEGGG